MRGRRRGRRKRRRWLCPWIWGWKGKDCPAKIQKPGFGERTGPDEDITEQLGLGCLGGTWP